MGDSMNNILILIILIVVLLITFLITMIIISKGKIQDALLSVEIANDDINNSLKQKYRLFKEIIIFIKDNLSIKDDAFKIFLEFDVKECLKEELIELLNKTTFEINKYVDNYDELLKNKNFLELKRKLYHTEMNFEAMIDYYNSKLNAYNHLKEHLPTSIATKLFQFAEYQKVEIDKKEISRLINLN